MSYGDFLLVVLGLGFLTLIVWLIRRPPRPTKSRGTRQGGSGPLVTKGEVIDEMVLIFFSDIFRRKIKNGHRLSGYTSLTTNPLVVTEHEILTRKLLGGRYEYHDPEVLERILRKLLQDDYERYWPIAEKQAIARRRAWRCLNIPLLELTVPQQIEVLTQADRVIGRFLEEIATGREDPELLGALEELYLKLEREEDVTSMLHRLRTLKKELGH